MSYAGSNSRRSFLSTLVAAPVLGAVTARALGDDKFELTRTPDPGPVPGPNDRIRIGAIGMGIIGFQDTAAALKVPGVELVAIADVYEGRRIHAQEEYGKNVTAYVDYRELIARKDIDAVLICVPDHWHAQMSIEAMKAGKAVYCEKPMVRDVGEGPDVVKVQKETGAVFQVGSQYASSILYDKAKEILASGAIGQLNSIEARYNRNNDIGAWQYTIPLDASPKTVDWDKFLGSAPKRDFDPKRFFRWRNYWDYGTAVAGDLYVHLFTGIHHATGAIGPERVSAMGGQRYWKDGREVYDIIMGIFDYAATDLHPSFTVALQTNFEDGGGGDANFRFVGSEGAIQVSFTELTLTKLGVFKRTAKEVLEGYNSVKTFSKAQQEALAESIQTERAGYAGAPTAKKETYKVPAGYDERLDHFINFFKYVREKKPAYEDATFGLRAAAPALLANESYRANKQILWDPREMKLVT